METSTADSGAGTLRQALLDAQSGDTITFDSAVFPPGAPATITLTSGLPDLDDGEVTIDASGAWVTLSGTHDVIVNPSPTWCGGTDVTVRATDPGGLWDEDTFRVAVSWSCPGP